MINKDSLLHKKIKGDENIAFHCPPMIFRDTPETPIIAFSTELYTDNDDDGNEKVNFPQVNFYDLNAGREIARAIMSEGFLGYFPNYGEGEEKENMLLLHRDILKLKFKDEAEEKSLGPFKNGYPRWYSVPVDFESMRQKEDVQEIITESLESIQDFMKTIVAKPKEEVLETIASQDRWIIVETNTPGFDDVYNS